LVDWSRSAANVCNQIRAMQPWPTAYTYLHRSDQDALRLILHRAAISAASPSAANVAMNADKTRLLVRCGDGVWIEILELQPAGKRRMSAQDFLRGNSIPADARMDGA